MTIKDGIKFAIGSTIGYAIMYAITKSLNCIIDKVESSKTEA